MPAVKRTRNNIVVVLKEGWEVTVGRSVRQKKVLHVLSSSAAVSLYISRDMGLDSSNRVYLVTCRVAPIDGAGISQPQATARRSIPNPS